MKQILLSLIKLYQKLISPMLPRRCRFYPTCSSYAHSAIIDHGTTKGLFISVKRLLRCHPFNQGGIDFPPKKL